jgi:CDGSH-type Zn-finger protein
MRRAGACRFVLRPARGDRSLEQDCLKGPGLGILCVSRLDTAQKKTVSAEGEESMEEPRMAERRPALAELEPGTYWWCACGRSAKQPFCDGSHKGTGLAPMKLEVAEKRKLALCQCKRTGNAPACDGSHRTL